MIRDGYESSRVFQLSASGELKHLQFNVIATAGIFEKKQQEEERQQPMRMMNWQGGRRGRGPKGNGDAEKPPAPPADKAPGEF